MSVDLSGEIPAIATAVLAAFAIVTVWYARRAFLKQSQEVGAIEQQVRDAQELARQQAELLRIQSGQLELQRQQSDEQHAAIEDQIPTNARQAEVAELQTEELRESLAERNRALEEQRRSQASKVTAWFGDYKAVELAVTAKRPEAALARSSGMPQTSRSSTSAPSSSTTSTRFSPGHSGIPPCAAAQWRESACSPRARTDSSRYRPTCAAPSAMSASTRRPVS
jgi:hypothetical protein